MSDSWNVTIFFEESGVETSARARLTGGNPLGHVVGSGHCVTSPDLTEHPEEVAMVRALSDLAEQLDLIVGANRFDAFARA